MAVRPTPCEAHMDQVSTESQSHLEVADILRHFGPSYVQTHSYRPLSNASSMISSRVVRHV